MHHDLRHYYLQQMGIETWECRLRFVDSSRSEVRRPAACPRDPEVLLKTPAHYMQLDRTGSSGQAAGRRDLTCQQTLASASVVDGDDIALSLGCAVHTTDTQSIVSRGNLKSKLLVIGDVFDLTADQSALPFAGKTGTLLTRMLHSISLSPDEVYLINLCPTNTSDDPMSQTTPNSLCRECLLKQIEMVAPSLIIVAGIAAGQCLLNTTEPLNRLRQTVHHHQGIPVVVTHHPGDLLLNPSDKNSAYQDFLRVQTLLL